MPATAPVCGCGTESARCRALLLRRIDMKHDGYSARDRRLTPARRLKTALARCVGRGIQQQRVYALFGDGFRAGYPPRFVDIDANADGHGPRQNRLELTRRTHSCLSNKNRGYIAFFPRVGRLTLGFGDGWTC